MTTTKAEGKPCVCRYKQIKGTIIYCPLHAAAPELLEALRGLCDALAVRCEPHVARDARNAARAAIAKAEGR